MLTSSGPSGALAGSSQQTLDVINLTRRKSEIPRLIASDSMSTVCSRRKPVKQFAIAKGDFIDSERLEGACWPGKLKIDRGERMSLPDLFRIVMTKP
jgi:hypothetical protein